jgi:hypothetical protein
MKKYFTLLLLLVGAWGTLYAQTTILPVCGQDLVREIMDTHYPEWAAAVDATYARALERQAQLRGPLTIPVVVHVVWRDAEENLSDELIHSQIAVLNQDFNRMNPDTGDLREIFKHVAGQADIYFELAAINRVQTTQTFSVNLLTGALAPQLKFSAQGGADAWDPEKYMNIWICKIQPIAIGPLVLGQILGFAFPPANLPHWPEGANAPQPGEDGVVVDYRVWGPDNPYPISIPGGSGNMLIKGRTPTHEVGHYLGLRHIWGDGGLLGPNDCQQSDGVDDTPFANAQSSFDCNKNKNTCTGVDPFYGVDMPDLVENFMDYSREDCMNMFTQGQVAIMRNVLAGPRAGLVEGSSSVTPDHRFAAGWVLSPNPARDLVQVRFEQPVSGTTLVQVLSAAGSVVFQARMPAGAQVLEIPTATLATGFYAVLCQSDAGTTRQKLVVMR